MGKSVSFIDEIKHAVGHREIECVSICLPLGTQSIGQSLGEVNLLTWEEFLDLSKDPKFNRDKPAVFLWSKDLVFFTTQYGNSIFLSCLPRNPTDQHTPWHY